MLKAQDLVTHRFQTILKFQQSIQHIHELRFQLFGRYLIFLRNQKFARKQKGKLAEVMTHTICLLRSMRLHKLLFLL